MHIYEYDCSACGERVEIRAGVADGPADVTCAACGSPNLRRHYGAVAIVGSRRQARAPGELRAVDGGDLTRESPVATRARSAAVGGRHAAERGGPAKLHESSGGKADRATGPEGGARGSIRRAFRSVCRIGSARASPGSPPCRRPARRGHGHRRQPPHACRVRDAGRPIGERADDLDRGGRGRTLRRSGPGRAVEFLARRHSGHDGRVGGRRAPIRSAVGSSAAPSWRSSRWREFTLGRPTPSGRPPSCSSATISVEDGATCGRRQAGCCDGPGRRHGDPRWGCPGVCQPCPARPDRRRGRIGNGAPGSHRPRPSRRQRDQPGDRHRRPRPDRGSGRPDTA
jgi:putative FmdB family regulatory protein